MFICSSENRCPSLSWCSCIYNHLLKEVLLFSDAPEVYVESSWVHAGEGQTAVLSCRVLANPAPKVLYFSNDHSRLRNLV